jgi:hypothetical protein
MCIITCITIDHVNMIISSANTRCTRKVCSIGCQMRWRRTVYMRQFFFSCHSHRYRLHFLFVHSVWKGYKDGSCGFRHTFKYHAKEISLHGHLVLVMTAFDFCNQPFIQNIYKFVHRDQVKTK